MIRIDPPTRVVVDPYLEGIANRQQQELPLVVVHAPERQPVREDINDPWTVHKVARDRGFVHVSGEYSRETMFRLIGQLERMAASL